MAFLEHLNQETRYIIAFQHLLEYVLDTGVARYRRTGEAVVSSRWFIDTDVQDVMNSEIHPSGNI